MKRVLVTLNAGLGGGLGPNFTITTDVYGWEDSATLTELLAGYETLVPDESIYVFITSLGVCINVLSIPIVPTTTTTSSTSTTTSTSSSTTTTTTTEPCNIEPTVDVVDLYTTTTTTTTTTTFPCNLTYTIDDMSGVTTTTTTSTSSTTTTTTTYNGAFVIAGTEYNNIRTLYTLDEINWNKPSIGYATNIVRVLRYGNGIWLMGGYLPDASWNDQDTMMYSSDGVNWTGMGLGILDYQVNDIAYGNGTWVAVGDGTNGTQIVYSTVEQPTSWSDWNSTGYNAFTGTYAGYGVAYDNGVWLAFGDPGSASIARSTDGINWTSVTNSTSTFDYFGSGAAYDGVSRWVATGGDNENLAYSDDNGLTWTTVASTIFGAGVAKGAYDIVYGEGKWVAVGEGNNAIAYSTDGVNWTGLGTVNYLSIGYAVEYLNGYFYTGGVNGSGTTSTLWKSDDGITWTALLTASPYPTILSIGTYI